MIGTAYIVNQIANTPIPDVEIVWSKGGKQNLWDDELAPLSPAALEVAKQAAKAIKNKATLKRIQKEEKDVAKEINKNESNGN